MVTRLDLGTREAAARAARITLLLTDCDGVLTDGAVYCDARGEQLLRFSRRDGMAAELLREAGIDVAILTRERSPIVEGRARKMGVALHEGVRDKRAWLAAYLDQHQHGADAIAYIGDDVNDLPLIAELAPRGLCAAPADAEPPVLEAVHLVCARPGGHGALRELSDFILALRAQRRLATNERGTP